MIIFPSRSTNSIFPEVNNGHVLSFTWFALFSSVHFPISSSSCLNLLFLIILNRYGIQFSHLLGDISPSFQSSVWFFSRPLHGCHPPTPWIIMLGSPFSSCEIPAGFQLFSFLSLLQSALEVSFLTLCLSNSWLMFQLV